MSFKHFGDSRMLGTTSDTAVSINTDARVNVAGDGHECGPNPADRTILAWTKYTDNVKGCFDEFFCCHV